jgi:acetolactate synthase-1/2/3 large subunit
VLIDIPMDVQRAEIQRPAMRAPITEPDMEPAMTDADARSIRDVLLRARSPLILAGGGIRAAGAVDAFRALVEIAHIPIVHSLMGVDVLPSGHVLNAGMIGSYGNRWSNIAVSESDLLLVLGSRLDVRQTGADTDGFKLGREIFHVDCEEAEMNNRVKRCHAVVSHLAPGIAKLLDVLTPVSDRLLKHSEGWLSTIARLRAEWPDVEELQDVEGINPNRFMHQLARATNDASAYVVDVGQHQMWAAQSIEIQPGQRFLTSGGMGSMGFGLPAAIGAAIAEPGSRVVMIAGDGSFQCNIQELQTVARTKPRLTMVVINNQCHGMVRQFQQSYFESRYQSTMWGYSAPDFAVVAEAYGIPSRTVTDPRGVDDAIEWLSENTDGPALLQVMISPLANAYPKLAFGKGMASMEPLIQPIGMEST